MSNHSQQIVQKLWNYCHVLRDDGMSCGDYVEPLTYLPFLTLAGERTRPPFNKPSTNPMKFGWSTPLGRDGDQINGNHAASFTAAFLAGCSSSPLGSA